MSASISGTLVLPSTTAPADLSLVTATASSVTGMRSVPGMPQVVGRPATLAHSLTVIGTPRGGPRSPRASARSASLPANVKCPRRDLPRLQQGREFARAPIIHGLASLVAARYIIGRACHRLRK